MAVVAHRRELTQRAAERILNGIKLRRNAAQDFYYKYSELRKTNQPQDSSNKRDEKEGKIKGKTFYGLPVIKEASWIELFENVVTTEESEIALKILIDSSVDRNELDPEEEFLRNYKINSFLTNGDQYHSSFEFVISRARDECQVFGDIALKHWCALLIQIAETEKIVPLGLQLMKQFIDRFGEPFHQNTRDLSQIKDETFIVTVVLLFEMCISESFSELNAYYRCKEEGIEEFEFENCRFQLSDLVKELFLICLPYPKYVNNKLRAVYSWFVKCWGVGSKEIIVLHSVGGDDRNSKEVDYKGFRKIQNPYSIAIQKSKFFEKTRQENITKVKEIKQYVQDRITYRLPKLLIERFLDTVYLTPFDPREMKHMILASYMLSIQTITGYGRAWVKNTGDDPEKMLKPNDSNFITRLCDMTENYIIQAYYEAERHGYKIVQPESMYSSLLRMAKNTSSGMSTSVEVMKTYGPGAERRNLPIRVVSRQKALVLMREGDKIYKAENLKKKFNTVESYQSKGQRDVPIKSTRIIYSIHISVLAPQLLLTLPINEYFAQIGGSTRPDARELGGKIIIGDLESTGSRVIDAGDTFRNTSDPTICTLALDYSEYDTHMTWHNFRKGMMEGMRKALSKYSDLRYEGFTVNELLEAGYGKGRLIGSLWNGRRRVEKMLKDEYDQLPEIEKIVPADAPFKFSPPGVKLIRNLGLIKNKEIGDNDEFVLVAPWDGSDLVSVSTHLSGENTTLVWNSIHNLAAGTIIREEIAKKNLNVLNVESEMYVGDDMLMYVTLLNHRGDVIDGLLDTVFDTIKLFGHEASEAKTTFLPFSAEKTQTHAKQGVYIGQDRMMFISSERRKDIEDVKSYMRANVNVFITKCSRGFSAELAHIILCFKSIFVGYRKLERTIMENGKMRSRQFDSIEDGYTLCMVRNPLTLYVPVDWNGYGAHPSALNVVMTPEIFFDSLMMESFHDEVRVVSEIAGNVYPGWDETKVDKHSLKTKTSMSLFSKLARKTVSTVLANEEVLKEVNELPLQGFGPTQISKTMMHAALLKEPKARTLLSPNYEVDYQKKVNDWISIANLTPQGMDLQITTQYVKIFQVEFEETREERETFYFPDRNLSPEFRNQKIMLGNRKSPRQRMSYTDQIDSILRGDVIMRGFITSNHILAVLEEVGIGFSAEDYALIFSLMNLDEKVCEKLGNYIARDKIRFDAQKLNKSGECGDEFSMSLDVCTNDMMERFSRFPHELTQTERDAVVLYTSQILMLRASKGIRRQIINYKVTTEHKRQVQRVRMSSKLPKRKHIKNMCMNIRSLSSTMISQQFL
ncbi:VP1 [Peruvian horse sickness virus]|uniref:RNA-directed RNA polymerase n=2 Tax=Peruvian horse sickness virus TaxID=356862 RepID=Q2Q1E4_9REOV|nr:VP1 [Peruvian horse sickness virus]ABB72770.1 VP1 [Peruvian horse sickness virus]